ncbi:MAG: fibronectin type III-like domain-contianing protein, partial [Verrucomicrobiota bacterium]|nr:fibronectin type III-like domain-contianing protein [Verrucomicrobiota bacterium]
LEVPATPLGKSDTLTLSVDVTNTGKRKGTETVHVFIRDLFASVVPPVKRLRAFRQVELSPGESTRVTFEIPVKDLSYFGLESSLVLDPGEFEVMIGGLRKRIAVH